MQTEAELDVGAAGRAQRDGAHPLNRPPRKRAPHHLSMTFGDHGQSSSVEHTGALTTPCLILMADPPPVRHQP